MTDLKNIAIEFGPHVGQMWTRLRTAYLRQLCDAKEKALVETDNGVLPAWQVAVIELKRRGSSKGSVRVTLHSIDRFSQLYYSKWKSGRKHLKNEQTGEKEYEGIASFVRRMASEAWSRRPANTWYGKVFLDYHGVTWLFKHAEGGVPVLITVE